MDVNKMFYTGYRCPQCKDTGWLIIPSQDSQDFAVACKCRLNGTFFKKDNEQTSNNTTNSRDQTTLKQYAIADGLFVAYDVMVTKKTQPSERRRNG